MMSILLDNNAGLPPVMQPPRKVFVRAARNQGDLGVRGDLRSHEHYRQQPTTIELPGSKYYTLRYLLNALLADGESVVRFPALSDDTAVLVRALRALGAQVRWEPRPLLPGEQLAGLNMSAQISWQLRVRGTSGQLMLPPGGQLHLSNAGAVLRLLLGLGALLPEVTYTTDHPDSLGRRPNADLLTALASLGIRAEAQGADGCLPITLRGGPPQGGDVTISGTHSSQYLSALLYLAPILPKGLDIRVTDELRSKPLVRISLRALAAAGIQIEAAPDLSWFHVPGGQTFQARIYEVPGDGPAAAALLAAALVLGRPLGLARLATAEDDVEALLAALGDLGARITIAVDEDTTTGLSSLQLASSGPPPEPVGLYGARINGDNCIDSVPVLAAIACFAQGETRFERVATLRLKESDRIGDLSAELQRAGAQVEPGEETITIYGHPEGIVGGVTVDSHDDHRLVQALAIAALRSANGLTIERADVVSKSYPDFFAALGQCGADVQTV